MLLVERPALAQKLGQHPLARPVELGKQPLAHFRHVDGRLFIPVHFALLCFAPVQLDDPYRLGDADLGPDIAQTHVLGVEAVGISPDATRRKTAGFG
jgi:hypothetical protein